MNFLMWNADVMQTNTAIALVIMEHYAIDVQMKNFIKIFVKKLELGLDKSPKV